jgi:hypothetical protein
VSFSYMTINFLLCCNLVSQSREFHFGQHPNYNLYNVKNLIIVAVVVFVTIGSLGKPQDHGDAPNPEGTASPPKPITLMDNSGHTTQSEKTPKAGTPIEWANWALVVVGLLTFIAVWKQIKESAAATQAMRDSLPLQKAAADAALLNAKAVINAERPWVAIFVIYSSKTGASFRAGNMGRTPAEIISFAVESRCVEHIQELPQVPVFTKEIAPQMRILVPGRRIWGS